MSLPPRLLCSDLDRAERFYADALGFEPEPAAEGVLVWLGAAGLLLVAQQGGAEPLPYPRGRGVTLSFVVEEVEAVYAGATAHGVRILQPLPDAPATGEDWAFQAMDLDGYVLRFVQPPGPSRLPSRPSSRPGGPRLVASR